MFSKSFMRYLINYQKDDCIVEDEQPKKIKFKSTNKQNPVRVTVRYKD